MCPWWPYAYDTSGEAPCCEQQLPNFSDLPHLRGAFQSDVGGALELSQLVPPELLGRVLADLSFSARNHLQILKRRWEFQMKPLSLPR